MQSSLFHLQLFLIRKIRNRLKAQPTIFINLNLKITIIKNQTLNRLAWQCINRLRP